MPFTDTPLSNGQSIPSIAFGTGTANKGKDVHQYVMNALDAGFTHIDTAQWYENEESVGTAIRESGLSRSNIFVTTKWAGRNQDIRSSLLTSLSKLGLEYVDLFLIHSPRSTEGKLESVWRSFEQVYEEGLTRSIGVSNFEVEDLQKLLRIARINPVVNQIKFPPTTWALNLPLLRCHEAHGIVTEGYSSLLPITQYPGGPIHSILAPIAKRLGATPAQVIFAWVRAKGVVIVTTTSKRERLEEYLAAGDLQLTSEDVAAIDKAGSIPP